MFFPAVEYQRSPLEVAIHGLVNNPNGESLEVRETDAGRGVFTMRDRNPGEFLIEYCGQWIQDEDVMRKREQMYADNGEGCFVVYTTWQGKFCAIDPTRQFVNVSKLLNHRVGGNVKLYKMLQIRPDDPPRLPMVVARPIIAGETYPGYNKKW